MITPPAGARVLLAAWPVDFRKGAHSLAALAAEALGEDPFSGAVLVFRSGRADRATFCIPPARDLAAASSHPADNPAGSSAVAPARAAVRR
jgi:transposase